jgi:hypothetical protein
MYVSLTRVNTTDQPAENATIVAQEMLRWLGEIEGFEGLLMLSREGSTLGLTFWASRDVADRHRVARRQFLERITATVDVEIEETVDYELTFADLPALVTQIAT